MQYVITVSDIGMCISGRYLQITYFFTFLLTYFQLLWRDGLINDKKVEVGLMSYRIWECNSVSFSLTDKTGDSECQSPQTLIKIL